MAAKVGGYSIVGFATGVLLVGRRQRVLYILLVTSLNVKLDYIQYILLCLYPPVHRIPNDHDTYLASGTALGWVAGR